jgi:branched-chain amino acid transport system substrate-binding protein
MDAFELYLEQNDNQLGGYDVELFKEDSAADPTVGIEATQKLLEQDGVDVLVGFVHSGVAYAAAPMVIDAGVPLIITTAGSDNLTQRDAAPNIFRVSYTGSQDAMPMGQYACNELGYEKVAVVALDYAFGWEAAGGFSKVFEEEGCEVVQELYVPLGTEDWGPFVQQIDKSADAVWTVNSSGDAIRFIQAYRDFGIDLPLISFGATETHELAELGDAAEGVVSTIHYAETLETELFSDFVTSYEETYDRFPTSVSEQSFAGAMVLDAALEEVDEVGSEAIIEAISAVEIDVPRGPISFDEYGQVIHNVYVREVREVDGEWVNQVIDTFEAVSQFWTYDPDEFLAEERFEDLKGSWEK